MEIQNRGRILSLKIFDLKGSFQNVFKVTFKVFNAYNQIELNGIIKFGFSYRSTIMIIN